jgi:hypothetical protein
MLITYDEDRTNIDHTQTEFNTVHPNIKYNIEKQENNKLNYLNIIIINTHDKLTSNIYRKPTTTDKIIHNDSCHPQVHKYSAIRYLINRMNTYPISNENKHHELQHTKKNTTKQ